MSFEVEDSKFFFQGRYNRDDVFVLSKKNVFCFFEMQFSIKVWAITKNKIVKNNLRSF